MNSEDQTEPNSAPVDPSKPAPAEPKKESWWSFLRFLAILFVATLVLRSCIVAPFSIPSGSMLPNLVIGDHLFVSKWPYGYSRYSFPFGIAQFDGRIMGSLPERGDIAVFRYPGPRDEDFVKRVIGLPGDTIELRGGTLFLNGQEARRERIEDLIVPVSPNSPCNPMGGETRAITDSNGAAACAYPRYRETLPGGRGYDILDQIIATPELCASLGNRPPCAADNFAPRVVPEGHVFVMGDNRDDSLDSRFPVAEGGVDLLPIDNLQGRALFSFFSTDGSAQWLLPWTWFTAARWDRLGMTYP